MARKSRKGNRTEMQKEHKEVKFQTAVYARLSIEDNGTGGASIDNQIEIIRQYVKRMPDLELAGTFADNGLTGTSFERPGFNCMLDSIRRGKINCIAVKDLSRFGRNYLETGTYLEKIFPELGVRFISVNDGFDSLHADNNDTLLISLKSILHDTYAKDISKKVSTALAVRKKTGGYMGKIPPYGYIREKEDRHKLVIHPEQAETVRLIFQWRLEGIGVAAIARRLNDMEVPTISKIRWLEGRNDGKENALWHSQAVLSILENPCYLGCIVERKSKAMFYKGENKTLVPRNEWRLIENTHEPIIDQETFDKAGELIEESARHRKRQLMKNSHRERRENILRGMVRCGICGGSVCRDGGYFRKDGTLVHYRFYCRNKYLRTGGCHSHSLDETELLDCIYQVCKKQIELLADENVLTAGYDRLRNSACLTKEMCAVMVEGVVVNGAVVRLHFTFSSELEGVRALHE